MLSKQVPLGIYEKALPAGSAGWSGYSSQNSWASILSKCRWMRRTSVLLASTGAANSAGTGKRHRGNGRARAVHVPERSSSFSARQRR